MAREREAKEAEQVGPRTVSNGTEGTEAELSIAEAQAALGKFVFAGRTLDLAHASEDDSVAGRVEALRIHLEETLGEPLEFMTHLT